MTKHILSVDDETAVRELIVEALTAAGFRVTGVATADEALQVIKNDPPQLILTDLQLEECDGFDLADRVKAVAPQLPVILLTGVLFDPEVVQGPAWQKIAAYLQKTSSLAEIVQTVTRHLPS
jgi:DNA-binding NtrC family response regulator